MSFLSNINNFFKKKKKSETEQLTEIKPVSNNSLQFQSKQPLFSKTNANKVISGINTGLDLGFRFGNAGANAMPFMPQLTEKAKQLSKTPFATNVGSYLRDKMGFAPAKEIAPATTIPQKIVEGTGTVVSSVAQFVAAGKVSEAVLSPFLKYGTAISSGAKYGYGAAESVKLLNAAQKFTGLGVKVTQPILNNALTWGLYTAGHLQGKTAVEKTNELTTAMITGGIFGKLQMVPGMNPFVKYLANALSPFIIKSTVGDDVEGAKGELPSYALMALIPFLGSVNFKPGSNPKLPAVSGPGFSGGVPPAGVVNPPAVPMVGEVPAINPVAPVQVPPVPAPIVPGASGEVIVPETTLKTPISIPEVKIDSGLTPEQQTQRQTKNIELEKLNKQYITGKELNQGLNVNKISTEDNRIDKTKDGIEVIKQVIDYKNNEFVGKSGINQKIIIPDVITEIIDKPSISTPEVKSIPIKDINYDFKRGQIEVQFDLSSGVKSNSPNSPIIIDEKNNVLDGAHRLEEARMRGDTNINTISVNKEKFDNMSRQELGNLGVSLEKSSTRNGPEFDKYMDENYYGIETKTKVIPEVKEPKTSLKKLEKQITTEKFEDYLNVSKDKEDYVKRVNVLKEQLNNPETKPDVKKLKQVKALINKELQNITGNISTGNWKRDFAFYQIMKQDPTMKEQVDVLEELLIDIDTKIGDGKMKKAFAAVERDLNLPTEGKYFITYGKYSTAGTRNREWVQENIPLLHMGNKRGMVGYILDVLGIEQKDLGSIAPEDVSHLKGITNVVDLFGGSGLMSNLSKKFFPNASINYNELDKGTLEAIEKAKIKPKEISAFVAQIGTYINKNPGADWVQHFKTVYAENEDFRVAAKLLEAAGGRTGEITKRKVNSILQAIPNFSKIFKDVKITNNDALAMMDDFAKNGKPTDLLWVDPPYIWSSGYNVGSTMEGAEGFINILDKLRALNNQGVKFVFFNNDPEVQVAKAGVQGAYLSNIMGKVNQLSQDGITIIKDIHPIGTTDRREMMITNLPYGLESGRLLNIVEVQKAIAALKDDPMAAPKELLKLFRDIRGSSRYVVDGKPLSYGQKKIIMALKKGLRIRNKEMTPLMDELLGDISLSKMTSIDGQKLIDWLQPKNFEVIESKIAMTRAMNAEQKHQAVLGELFAAKDVELEDKFGVLTAVNKTVQEMDNLVKLLKLTPLPKEMKNVSRRVFGGLSGGLVSEDLATSILGIKESFHTPMRTIINISNSHVNRMRKLKSAVAKLSESDREQVAMIQGGAEKYIKGPISPEVKRISNYWQELSEANITLINRIRVARGELPIPSRKPYIPYIINEDLQMAANLFDKNKFWEVRTKTPQDFAAGLFTHDLNKIIDTWSLSMGNWLKKNLYGALLADRMDEIFKVNNAATAYAREMVMLDIYDQIPGGIVEKLYRTVGGAINESVGKIWPKRIKIDSDLAKSVLNTTFGQELKSNINNGYIEIPRVQLPNIMSAFHLVYYPAKLAWNIGFGLLNLQQPWSGLPFVGSVNKLKGRLAPFYVMMPWNKLVRKHYMDFLEESGYEFGRYIEGTELAGAKGKIGNIVNRSINFIGDATEFSNRMESMMEATYYLGGLEKKFGAKLSENDKLRIAARYSGFINFLAGKGYSPLAQRTTSGRFLYTFGQYPINQFNVFFEQWKYATKDEGVKKFWQMMTAEAGGSEEAFKFFDNLKKTGKKKTMGLIFLSLLAMVLPVATLYTLTRNWDIASRGIPSMPRVAAEDLITAVTTYTNDPSEDTLGKLNQAIKQFFAISSTDRLKDSLDIYQTGVLQSSVSKKPLFVQKNLENAINVLVFGRSALDEYTKRYPSWLQTTMTGDNSAKELSDLQGERLKIQGEETQTAYEATKKILSGDNAGEYISSMVKQGKWNSRVADKMKGYLQDYALDRGGMENAVINLSDVDQAKFVIRQLEKLPLGIKRAQKIIEFRRLGIITPNVQKEMVKIPMQN